MVVFVVLNPAYCALTLQAVPHAIPLRFLLCALITLPPLWYLSHWQCEAGRDTCSLIVHSPHDAEQPQIQTGSLASPTANDGLGPMVRGKLGDCAELAVPRASVRLAAAVVGGMPCNTAMAAVPPSLSVGGRRRGRRRALCPRAGCRRGAPGSPPGAHPGAARRP